MNEKLKYQRKIDKFILNEFYAESAEYINMQALWRSGYKSTRLWLQNLVSRSFL